MNHPYTVITVPGQMILGLALALLLDQPLRARAAAASAGST